MTNSELWIRRLYLGCREEYLTTTSTWDQFRELAKPRVSPLASDVVKHRFHSNYYGPNGCPGGTAFSNCSMGPIPAGGQFCLCDIVPQCDRSNNGLTSVVPLPVGCGNLCVGSYCKCHTQFSASHHCCRLLYSNSITSIPTGAFSSLVNANVAYVLSLNL